MIFKRHTTITCSCSFSPLIVILDLAACPRAGGEGILASILNGMKKIPLKFAVANSGNDRGFTASLRPLCGLGVNAQNKKFKTN